MLQTGALGIVAYSAVQGFRLMGGMVEEVKVLAEKVGRLEGLLLPLVRGRRSARRRK